MAAPARVLAFDLGGTRLKAGIVDARAGVVAERRVVETPKQAAAALDRVVEVGRDLMQGSSVDAVGLCVPGLVDAGRIFALPGKLEGIIGLDLGVRLATSFSAPAEVVNDALAFGLGEAVFGAARGHRRAVVITIGTGIGVGVYEDGRPLGSGPLGGGLLGGQIPVFEDPGGATDTNGRTGTIEARCAASRIVAAARSHGAAADDVPAVFALARAGDAAARAGIEEYRKDLTRALVALAHAHAPSVLVLGGGPMRPDNPVLDGLEAAVRVGLWPGYSVDVVAAACGDDAALLGVATMAAAGGRR